MRDITQSFGKDKRRLVSYDFAIWSGGKRYHVYFRIIRFLIDAPDGRIGTTKFGMMFVAAADRYVLRPSEVVGARVALLDLRFRGFDWEMPCRSSDSRATT